MKIGCCGTTADLNTVKNMGYDFIELSARQLMTLSAEEFEKFCEKYDSLGFPCLGFNSLCGEELPLVGPYQNITELERYMNSLCCKGNRLGIRNIGIGAPAARILPEDYPKEKADRQMRDFLNIACDIAEGYGQRILLEAVHKYACNYLTKTREAVEMVQKVNRTSLLLILDFYHAMMMGEDVHALDYAFPYVSHLHYSTGGKGEARGFPTTREFTLISDLLYEAKVNGYDSTISIEADFGMIHENGEMGLKIVREALSC